MAAAAAAAAAPSWYTIRTPGSTLEQGDQLDRFAAMTAVIDAGEPAVEKAIGDYIILTQSCDLLWRKVAHVLLAPVHPLTEWLYENPEHFGLLDAIREGHEATLYLLPAWVESEMPSGRFDRIANLRAVVSVAIADVEMAASNRRLGLASPYLEHFGQAVARSFMRVGLPSDIPKFDFETRASGKDVLRQLTGVDDLVEGRRATIRKEISLAKNVKRRLGSDLVVLTTTNQPKVVGIGTDDANAMESLSRQLVIKSADAKWGWLHDHVEIAAT